MVAGEQSAGARHEEVVGEAIGIGIQQYEHDLQVEHQARYGPIQRPQSCPAATEIIIQTDQICIIKIIVFRRVKIGNIFDINCLDYLVFKQTFKTVTQN